MDLGFPTSGFSADNAREFANVKLDELACKLEIMVRFKPAYSPWPMGSNEQNHYGTDILEKKRKLGSQTALFDT